MEKDEEYRIVDEDTNKKEAKKIVVIIKSRKEEITKPTLVDQVNLQFNHYHGYEGLHGSYGLNPKTGFQTICKEQGTNGEDILRTTYSFSSFEQLLVDFFDDNHVTHYLTEDTKDLFLYLKTPIGTNNNKPIYPEIELGFIAIDSHHEPNVFANVYENKHKIVQNVEFSRLNQICKTINTKRAQKQEDAPKF